MPTTAATVPITAIPSQGSAPAGVPPERVDGCDAAADCQGQSDCRIDDRTDHPEPGFGHRVVRGLAVIFRRELAGEWLRQAIAMRRDRADLPSCEPELHRRGDDDGGDEQCRRPVHQASVMQRRAHVCARLGSGGNLAAALGTEPRWLTMTAAALFA